MKYFIVILFVGFLFWGCEKPPSYANKPVITSASVAPGIVRSSSDTFADAQSLPASVVVQIGFTDGNGDIGIPSGDSTDVDAFLIDSRSTPSGQLVIDTFRIPYITPDGNIKSISGTISFTVTQLYGRDDTAHTNWDTLHYTVIIRDRNGINSNPFPTSPIYIKDN